MNYLTETHPNSQKCLHAMLEHVRKAQSSGKRPVIIVSGYDQQKETQRYLAQNGCGFGVEVSTLKNWVDDLWGLFGNGTALASHAARSVMLSKVLQASDILQDSPGMLDLLCNAASIALLYMENKADLSASEQEAINILKQYRKDLTRRGLTEYSEALLNLSKDDCLQAFEVATVGIREDQISQAEATFLEACEATVLLNAQESPCEVARNEELAQVQALLYQRSDADCPVNASGAVRFALSAGPSANSKSVLDAIFDMLDQGCDTILVADPDPCQLFDFCLSHLEGRNIGCGLVASKVISNTCMGHALAYLGDLTQNATMDPAQAQPILAADFAINPFSGIDKASAFRIAKMHRGNRLTDQDAILTDLASSSDDALSGVINRIEEGAYCDALAILRQFVSERYSHNQSFASEQLRVLDVFDQLCLEGEGLSLPHIFNIASKIPVKACVESRPNPQVLFTTQAQASGFAAGSFDCTIISSLNSDSMPVQAKENALATLLAKLGCPTRENPLAQARANFYSTFETAKNAVVLQRCLNNEKGDPSQAAVVFEELVDCYRPSITQDTGMNKILGIPESMAPLASQLGEQDVLSNAGIPPRQIHMIETPRTGDISEESRHMVVLPQRYTEGFFEGLDMSPSQIESYLECPYSWFAKRRLHLEGLDEGFGPMERGTFVHEVLRKFYQRFQEQVGLKVTVSTLESAKEIMAETFHQVSSEQPFERHGMRYVPRNAWEEKEQQSVLPKLLKYLEMETCLLPGLHPVEFEWQFAKAKPFPYAGCNLRGCIDRIDIDDHGNAVVIDYKSSLNNDYRLFDSKNEDVSEGFHLPKKMQTLMYSKVVRESLGLQVVGALYVNPLKQEVLGSYDARVLGPEDIPFAKSTDAPNCQVPYPFAQSMDQLIDICEENVRERLARLAQGIIEPDPIGEKACELCPANACGKRLAQRRR